MRINTLHIRPLFIALFMVLIYSGSSGQNFSAVFPGLNTCISPAVAWADFDNDGDLDIFMTGIDDGELPVSYIYRNDGNGNFQEVPTGITGLAHASCDIGDVDNDGDADLAVSGWDGNNKLSKIYLNDGDINFTEMNAGILGLSHGSLAWGDADHDSYPDLLISGLNGDDIPVTKFYRNVAGTSFVDSIAGIEDLANGHLAWNDFDQDGDMDIGICGRNGQGQATTMIYVNTEGLFEPLNASLTGLSEGMLGWGDYNNDGFADLLIAGTDDNNQSQTLVYKNISGQSFNLLPGAFLGASEGSALWGDMNNDGSLDFMVAGWNFDGTTPPPPPGQPFMNIYRNTGNDSFELQSVDLDIPVFNAIALGDYDNDTDLDMLVTGTFSTPIGDTMEARLFLNGISTQNVTASAPQNLSFQVTDDILSFQWDAASANTTPQGGLNYNLRVGTQPGNMDVYSALADIGTGYRYIAAHGNAGPNTDITLHDLPFGNYYASVQAIDHTYAGSAFSTDITIPFLPTASFSIDDSICVNFFAEIIYTGNASPQAQYIWDWDGGQTSGSGQGPGPHFVSWTASGVKTVTLTVIEDDITSDPVSHAVMVVDPVNETGIINGPDDICQGTVSSTYTTISIPGAINYHWLVEPAGAGVFTGSGLQAVLVWDPAFHDTAMIYVEGVNACGTGPSSEPLEVLVRPLPGTPATPQGPDALCQPPPVTEYTTLATPYASYYTWQLLPEEAGSVSGGGSSTEEVTWDENFTGTASLVVTGWNQCGAGPVSESLEIVVEQSPVADAGEDQTIDYQTATQLDGTASGTSGSYSYYWTPAELLDDPTAEDPQTVPLEFTTTFTLTVTDEESSCQGSDQVTVNITGGPLSVVASAEPAQVCPGAESQLKAQPTGGSGYYIYSWTSIPEGFTSSVKEPLVTPDTTTIYIIELNDTIDVVTDSITIVVLDLPGAAGSVSGSPGVCLGAENILYEIEAVPGADKYRWDLGEGVFGNSDSTSILLSFSNDPQFSTTGITVFPVNSCGEGDSAFLAIEILQDPAAPGIILGPDSICTTVDTIVNYTLDAAVPQATAYEWKLIPEEAGTITANGPDAQLHWVRNWVGSASIIVRALNECGYSDWSDALHVSTFSCVGVNELITDKITMLAYPNPADETLYLNIRSTRGQEHLQAEITDLYGRLIRKLDIDRGTDRTTINTASLPDGMYLLRVTGRNTVLEVTKIIVRH